MDLEVEGSSPESNCNMDFNDEARRSSRKKTKTSDPICCPVCSITLRSSEMDAHLASELDSLNKFLSLSNARRSRGRSSEPSTSSNDLGQQWETYQKVRSNRLRRQRNRTGGGNSEETMPCPVCNEEIAEEINLHVERCLLLNSQDDDSRAEGGLEQYEWVDETRVRATSLLQEGVSNLGTSLSVTEENEEVVVDVDDTTLYGLTQYSQEDIMGFVSSGNDYQVPRSYDSSSAAAESEELSSVHVLEALKNRIRDLESQTLGEVYKCLICMGPYRNPVISTGCWHVYCEQCWLRTLAAKKLCPQCNVITTPDNLRRIYI